MGYTHIAIRERRAHPHREVSGMAFVHGRTSFEERFVEAVVPLTASSLTAGSFSGRVAWGPTAPTAV